MKKQPGEGVFWFSLCLTLVSALWLGVSLQEDNAGGVLGSAFSLSILLWMMWDYR